MPNGLSLQRTLASLALALVALVALPLSAAELIVTKTTDSADGVCDADCSLREAIEFANAQPGPHSITLPSGVFTLSIAPPTLGWYIEEEDNNQNGDLDVRSHLTIIGAGPSKTIIDGGQIDRLFDVHANAFLHLEQLTLRNGRTSGYGGAVRYRGDGILRRAILRNNEVRSPGAGGGGAISNKGYLQINSVLLEENRTLAAAPFGQGGAIFNHRGGLLSLDGSRLTGNLSSDDLGVGRGGALFNEGNAGSDRTVFDRNALPREGYGSAILNYRELNLRNVTVTGNDAREGFGTVANGSYEYPGATFNTMMLLHVTIADNAGRWALWNNSWLSARNSIAIGNRFEGWGDSVKPSNCMNSGGSTVFLGESLMLGRDTQNGCETPYVVDDAIAFTEVLDYAADNGGSTLTHALREGSPAIDAGLHPCYNHDQRKVARPQDGNGDGVATCDFGAFEFIPDL